MELLAIANAGGDLNMKYAFVRDLDLFVNGNFLKTIFHVNYGMKKTIFTSIS